jgi:Domain of unknown function DUF29.
MGAIAYEQDYYGWTQEQSNLMKARKVNEIDWEHLIEEVESMGLRERKELVNRLRVLLMHLLKWQYQPNYAGRSSWERTIKVQRKEIFYLMKDNPSLKPEVPASMERAYNFAIDDAESETGISASHFPQESPWTFEQVMDVNFWPESAE